MQNREDANPDVGSANNAAEDPGWLDIAQDELESDGDAQDTAGVEPTNQRLEDDDADPEDESEEGEPVADDEETPETDEADDDDEEAEPEVEDDHLEFEVDGQTVKVTADEYRLGYLRQTDYQRKTQDLAAQRRGLDTQMQEVVQVRNRAMEAVEQERQAMLSVLAGELNEPEPDWIAIAREDPFGDWQIQQMEFNQRRDKRVALYQEHAQAHDQNMQALHHQETQAQSATLERERVRMLERIPEWQDRKVAVTEMREIKELILGAGYTPEEADSIGDSRLMAHLRQANLDRKDAESYRALKTKGPKTAKKVSGKPKTLSSRTPTKPSTVKQKRLDARSNRLRETGDSRDAAALFYEELADEFS